jgi:hypothetical protein
MLRMMEEGQIDLIGCRGGKGSWEDHVAKWLVVCDNCVFGRETGLTRGGSSASVVGEARSARRGRLQFGWRALASGRGRKPTCIMPEHFAESIMSFRPAWDITI